MSLRDALKAAGASKLSIVPGDVCVVADESVVLPQTPQDKRKLHPYGRTCIILTNEHLCQRVTYPLVTIIPTSTQIHLKEETDYLISPTDENGLKEECLAMLGHIQPVRKADLYKKIGNLSAEDWDGLCAHLLWYFDLQD